MELDHQQMAGASFGKPITAALPGIWGDWLPGVSPVQKLHPFGSFIWFSLFIFSSLLTSRAVPQSSICCCSRQAGKSEQRALELQAMAPWELATLGTPRLRKCLCHCNTCEKSSEASSNSLQNEESLLRPAFNKQMKGEAIYCRAWGSCNRIKSLWVLALR